MLSKRSRSIHAPGLLSREYLLRAALISIAACFICAAPPAAAEIVRARVLLAEGDVPADGDGQPVAALNSPFTNGHGQVGFVGELAPENSFIWIDDEIVWKNSDAPVPLDGEAESTMGVSDAGGFIYSTTMGVDDLLITHNGLLAKEGEPIPGSPAIPTFLAEPTMGPSGRAYWIAEIDVGGDAAPEGRVLYTSADARPESTEIVLAFTDTVQGIPIKDEDGIRFDYQVTDNRHHIHTLLLETGDPATERVVYVDGAIVAQAGFATGDGDLWELFDLVSINRAGDYVFSGNTDGPSEMAEFVAHNGGIVLREGDTIDGIPLTGSARIRALSLNELGHSAFLWQYGSTETLFFACDAANPRTTAVAILSVGDLLDLDGDGSGELWVVDFIASELSGPGLSLSERPVIHVELEVDDAAVDDLMEELEAIVELRLPTCGNERVTRHPSLDHRGAS